MGKRYANYTIDAATVVKRLGTMVPIVPETERQARPLTRLEPERILAGDGDREGHPGRRAWPDRVAVAPGRADGKKAIGQKMTGKSPQTG